MNDPYTTNELFEVLGINNDSNFEAFNFPASASLFKVPPIAAGQSQRINIAGEWVIFGEGNASTFTASGFCLLHFEDSPGIPFIGWGELFKTTAFRYLVIENISTFALPNFQMIVGSGRAYNFASRF